MQTERLPHTRKRPSTMSAQLGWLLMTNLAAIALVWGAIDLYRGQSRACFDKLLPGVVLGSTSLGLTQRMFPEKNS